MEGPRDAEEVLGRGRGLFSQEKAKGESKYFLPPSKGSLGRRQRHAAKGSQLQGQADELWGEKSYQESE